MAEKEAGSQLVQLFLNQRLNLVPDPAQVFVFSAQVHGTQRYSSPTTLKFFSRTKSNMSREIYVSFYVFNGRYLHVTSRHIYCLLPISGPVPEPFLTCNTTFLQKKRPEIRTHILKSNKLVHPPKLMKKVFKKPDINQDNIVAVDVRKRK